MFFQQQTFGSADLTPTSARHVRCTSTQSLTFYKNIWRDSRSSWGWKSLLKCTSRPSARRRQVWVLYVCWVQLVNRCSHPASAWGTKVFKASPITSRPAIERLDVETNLSSRPPQVQRVQTSSDSSEEILKSYKLISRLQKAERQIQEMGFLGGWKERCP